MRARVAVHRSLRAFAFDEIKPARRHGLSGLGQETDGIFVGPVVDDVDEEVRVAPGGQLGRSVAWGSGQLRACGMESARTARRSITTP